MHITMSFASGEGMGIRISKNLMAHLVFCLGICVSGGNHVNSSLDE